MAWTARAIVTTGTPQGLLMLTRAGTPMTMGSSDVVLQLGDQIEAIGCEVEFTEIDIEPHYGVKRISSGSIVEILSVDGEDRPVITKGKDITFSPSAKLQHPRVGGCPKARLIVSIFRDEESVALFYAFGREVKAYIHDEAGEHVEVSIPDITKWLKFTPDENGILCVVSIEDPPNIQDVLIDVNYVLNLDLETKPILPTKLFC